MDDYEAARRRHVDRAMALAPRLIEQLDWTEEPLAANRGQRLRGLVALAIDRSPWHRERLGGLDPARLSEESLRELPPMTKTDLMEHFDEIVTDRRLTLERVNRHLESVATPSYLPGGPYGGHLRRLERGTRRVRLRLGWMGHILGELLSLSHPRQAVRP